MYEKDWNEPFAGRLSTVVNNYGQNTEHNDDDNNHFNFLGNTWQALEIYVATIVAVTICVRKQRFGRVHSGC